MDSWSQPIVNNPVPDEQHCENDESDTVKFNEDTELLELEVAEDVKEHYVFESFYKSLLSSN